MLRLRGHGWNVPLACDGLLLRCGARADATIATVVADPVDGSGVVDYRRVVDVVNVSDIQVAHRTVVVELSVLPTWGITGL